MAPLTYMILLKVNFPIGLLGILIKSTRLFGILICKNSFFRFQMTDNSIFGTIKAIAGCQRLWIYRPT